MNNAMEQIFLLNPSDLQPCGSLQKVAETPTAGQVNLENVEDFSTVCRTCATITEFVIPIFSGEGLQNNLADKIHKHLPIKVTEEDQLPRAVCYQCATTILAWHELVTCCQQADTALRTRLERLQQTASAPAQDRKPVGNDNSQVVENNQQKEQNRENVAEFLKVEIKMEDLQEPKTVYESKDTQIKPSTITITEDGRKYAECQTCKKSLTIASLRRHVRSHQGEKRYSCHTCGLSFSDSGNLARHTRALHTKQRPHTCPVCRKSFSRNSHLQDHIKSHSENREYVCDLCGKASKSSAALRMHRRTHGSELKFGCMECGARFKRGGELRAHVSVHTGEKAHVCACGRAFRLKSQLTAHSRTHRPLEDGSQPQFEDMRLMAPPSYPLSAAAPLLARCQYCATQHPPAAYRDHLIRAHTDLLFHCDECDAYVDRKDFILHMSFHVVEYSSGKSKEESKKTSKKKKIIKDENENTELNERTVPSENKTAELIKENVPEIKPVDVANLKTNKDDDNEFSDHSDTEFEFGPLPESVFEAIEDSQESHRVHNEPSRAPEVSIQENKIDIGNERVKLKTNEDVVNTKLRAEGETEKPIEELKVKKHKRLRTCPICGKVYTASSSYFYHMKSVHNKARDYECDLCGRKFLTKVVLSQHMVTHSDICENECKICGKKMKSKSSLYIHTQNHIGTKTFSCDQCKISFRWRTHLMRHLKRHSAEKTHKCATCGRGFTIHCDMLRHMRTHSAGRHECNKCGVSFAQARYLKAHMDKKHSAQVVAQKDDAVPVHQPEVIPVNRSVVTPMDSQPIC